MGPLFPWRRKEVGPLVIERMEVEGLRWNIGKGVIEYRFKVRTGNGDLVLSINPGLEFSEVFGAERVASRIVVEKDYGWARLRVLRARRAGGSVGARVHGSPVDFTLSRLGVRYGRALLRDELLWHPILGDKLATWGTRGHIASYNVHVAHKSVVGPRVPEEVEDGVVFRGEPELRMPGVTVIGGLRVVTRGDSVAAVPPGNDSSIALRVLEWTNEASTTVAEDLGVKAPSYEVAALIWDDVEPFVSDKLLAVRNSVTAPLLRRNSSAVHEILHLISIHIVYNRRLESLNDYWLYEVLPHVLALYAIHRVAPTALEGALGTLRKCVESFGGPELLPGPATVIVPKSQKHHASLACKAPLIFWYIAEKRGVEALSALLACMLSENITVDLLRKCLQDVLGVHAEEFIRKHFYGKSLPR